MKITKISFCLGIFGIAVILVSTIQWFFLYNDLSQFLLGNGICVILLGFAYLHNWMRGIDEDIIDTNKGLDSLVIWATNELDKINTQYNNKEVKTNGHN